MVATDAMLAHKLNTCPSAVSIPTGPDGLPIEITLTAKLPPGTGSFVVGNALERQKSHPEFIDEYNEPSAIIGKTNFESHDPTAVYTFGVDTRSLVFHRHEGHRIITAITGGKGCLLKFSLCTAEEARNTPEKFLEKLYIVEIPADRMFVLRFAGTVYHQFCPRDKTENAFFAISAHTNEAGGLSGEILDVVLSNKSSIALLTEPAPPEAMKLLDEPDALQHAIHISLDLD
jgi:hypothetical protein